MFQTHDQCPQILDAIKAQFPKWNPTDTQLVNWRRGLGAYRLVWVEEALYRLMRDKSPATPRMKDIIEQLNHIRDRNAQPMPIYSMSAKQRIEIDTRQLDEMREAWRFMVKQQDPAVIEAARTSMLKRYPYHECLKHKDIDHWTMGAIIAVMWFIDDDSVDYIMETGGVLGDRTVA